MHLKDVAQKFNVSHFIIYGCLLLLSVLTSLQVEGVISQSYGIIFFPLWVWNALTFTGTIGGVVLWIRKKKLRREKENRQNFIAMLQSSILQFIVFIEEVLLAVNLDLGGCLSWPAVFVPLYVLSVVSVVACIFSCCAKRCNVELEILGFVNIIQLIFLGIRLEDTVTWRWAVVLIPTWILLIVTFVLTLFYTCIQCCLISVEENQLNTELRKPLVTTSVVAFSLSTISFTIFLALLVSRLDSNLTTPYTIIFIPLHISILFLFPTLFTRQPANPFWFGLRRNFVEAVLELCPFFGEYLNTSWTKNADEAGKLSEIRAKIKSKHSKSKLVPESILVLDSKNYPYLDIMTPD